MDNFEAKKVAKKGAKCFCEITFHEKKNLPKRSYLGFFKLELFLIQNDSLSSIIINCFIMSETFCIIFGFAFLILNCFIDYVTLLFTTKIAFFNVNSVRNLTTFGFMRGVALFFISDIVRYVIIGMTFLIVMVITSL